MTVEKSQQDLIIISFAQVWDLKYQHEIHKRSRQISNSIHLPMSFFHELTPLLNHSYWEQPSNYSSFPSTPHLPPKGPCPSAPPPVVPHALWRCGCHQRPRARRNLQGQWSDGEKGWMKGGTTGDPNDKKDTTKTNTTKNTCLVDGCDSELIFFSNWKSI